jgi:glycosyltransferase involved in cell wall biosynthesis
MESQRFIVFSCGYNCEKYVEQHVESIKSQTYNNFIHVIVDDASTDRTYELLTGLYYSNMKLIHNKKNGKWVKNAVENLDTYIESDEDVIVQVDLDDELFHSNILKDLNEYYSNKDIWCTFSKWTMDKKKSIVHGGPTDYNIIKNRKFRGEKWGPIGLSHLQTFKSFLWKNINKEDFKDERNNYFEESQDHSIYFPIAEMVPIEKILFIDDVQYLYNIEHSCEWNKRSFMQELCHTKIDKLLPYDILNIENNIIRDVTLTITTFNRDNCLYRLIDSIRKYYPDIKILVADNGSEESTEIHNYDNVEYFKLPFDSGLSISRNLLIDKVQTKYYVSLDDDYVFTENTKLEIFKDILDNEPDIDLVAGKLVGTGAGTCSGIIYIEDDILTAEKGLNRGFINKYPIYDIVVYFFMARVDKLRPVRWDTKLKIAPEHIDFFFRGKNIFTSTQIENVEIDHAKHMIDTEYMKYRRRGDGEVEYCKRYKLKGTRFI